MAAKLILQVQNSRGQTVDAIILLVMFHIVPSARSLNLLWIQATPK